MDKKRIITVQFTVTEGDYFKTKTLQEAAELVACEWCLGKGDTVHVDLVNDTAFYEVP